MTESDWLAESFEKNRARSRVAVSKSGPRGYARRAEFVKGPGSRAL
jgi:hypothetical protein